MRYILILFILVIINGCAAGGAKFGEIQFIKNDKLSEIFVFRLDKFVAGGSCYEIGIDKNSIGVLGNGGFIRKELSAGNHIITIPMIDKSQLNLSFDTDAMQTKYFQFNVALNDTKAIPESEILSKKLDYTFSQGELLHFDTVFVQVRPEYAIKELQSLRDSSEKVSCMATVSLEN